jgi:hypothetical protein
MTKLREGYGRNHVRLGHGALGNIGIYANRPSTALHMASRAELRVDRQL